MLNGYWPNGPSMVKKITRPCTLKCKYCDELFTYDRRVQTGIHEGKWMGRARSSCGSTKCEKLKAEASKERAKKRYLNRKARKELEAKHDVMRDEVPKEPLTAVFEMLGVPLENSRGGFNSAIYSKGDCINLYKQVKQLLEPTTEALLWEIADMIADYNSRPDAKSKLGLSITESDL